MPKNSKKIPRISLAQTVDSVIVHDMKNLAFRLSALLQNMEQNYDNPLFKQSMSDILADTVHKMDSIVKRFREHQQQVVIKLRIDVNQIVKELLASLPARKIRDLKIESSFDELPQIWGDGFYLHNAFHSILENALDAMPHGGTLSARTLLARRGKKHKIHVEISDTGVGMTQNFMETKLFHPFSTTKDQGLGLGLFTSQQIIGLHQGRIQVESSPGQGTTFRVILPVDQNGS
jgi:signal transduction histidine kinase